MRRDGDWARARFASARVGRLATVRPDGSPHVVPVVFALSGDRLITPIDHKPKRSSRLQRLANIAAEPRVSVVVDHYDEDWSQLWWARADGRARILPEVPGTDRDLLAAKYADYARTPPTGQLIVVDVTRWSGWASV